MRLGQDGLSKILSLNNLSRLEVAKKKNGQNDSLGRQRREITPAMCPCPDGQGRSL